jgi:two-component system, NtrC family, response regulator AtoC
VQLLAQHFIDRISAQAGKKVTGLSPVAAERLVAYAWPGNVRELQSCIERAVALASFEKIVVEDLPEKIRSYHSSHIIVAGADPTELVSMGEVEQRYIQRVLEAVGGNKSQAARILVYNRRTLYRKLDEHKSGDSRRRAS